MKKLILILSVFLVSCYSTELVNVKAVVLSHNTSSTDYGSIHYNSIIKLENAKCYVVQNVGFIEEESITNTFDETFKKFEI